MEAIHDMKLSEGNNEGRGMGKKGTGEKDKAGEGEIVWGGGS